VLASAAYAVEPAFTGTNYATFDDGSWGQSQISLFGLAQPGDTVQLRFQMHLNPSDGVHGWYVADVQAYYCQSCNNGKLNAGESCDDGNTIGGDGCSATCQIEPDWYCKDPLPTLSANDAINDGGFENSGLTAAWQMASTNAATLLCGPPDCPFSAHQGLWTTRFGHASLYERSTLT
jgi:cysteine-rich repeat protein